MVHLGGGELTREVMASQPQRAAAGPYGPGPDSPAVAMRLVVVDGVATVRRGIRALIEAELDLRVVGEAESTDQAMGLVEGLTPDVVLTEVKGPTLDGLELARRVKRAQPAPGVVFLTQFQSPAYFFEALRCGCDGYILKSASPQQMLYGIRCVPRGYRYLDPAMVGWLVREYSPQARRRYSNSGHRLSAREFQILELVARGHTNREMACQLHVSVNTVRHHRTRLMGKLGLHTIAELVRFALNEGLLEA